MDFMRTPSVHAVSTEGLLHEVQGTCVVVDVQLHKQGGSGVRAVEQRMTRVS